MPAQASESGVPAAPAQTAPWGWLRDFLPASMPVDARERLRVVAGAIVGILITALLCRAFGAGPAALPWLVAPIGASAVLVFGVPSSPLAQPWAVAGGNALSALVGIVCVQAFGTAPWVAALAVGLAIGAMFALRCLHPPGGASALFVVLASVHELSFALFPILANSLLLVLAGIAYNHATGRRYPHGQRPAPAPASREPRAAFTEADLDAVLKRRNEVLDVSRDELRELLNEAEVEAYRRKFGEVRCADIMSRDLVTAEFGTPLQEAWQLLRQRNIKSLPVVNRAFRITGIVTIADFMRSADLDLHEGWTHKLRSLLRPTPTTHSDKPEVVGQIMTRQVRVISADRPIADLVPLFADTSHHHIPVIDTQQRLVGIITQSDLVAALCHGR